MNGETFLQTAAAIDETQEAIDRIINAPPVCDQNKTVQCGRSCGEYYVSQVWKVLVLLFFIVNLLYFRFVKGVANHLFL